MALPSASGTDTRVGGGNEDVDKGKVDVVWLP